MVTQLFSLVKTFCLATAPTVRLQDYPVFDEISDFIACRGVMLNHSCSLSARIKSLCIKLYACDFVKLFQFCILILTVMHSRTEVLNFH